MARDFSACRFHGVPSAAPRGYLRADREFALQDAEFVRRQQRVAPGLITPASNDAFCRRCWSIGLMHDPSEIRPSEVWFVRVRYVSFFSRVPIAVFGAYKFGPVQGAVSIP